MRSRDRILSALLLFALVVSSACGSKEGGGEETGGVIIVNAPAAGEVRRVLVNEGAQLKKGDAVVEIAIHAEGPAPAPTRGEGPVAAAGRNITSAQAKVESARADVVTAEGGGARLTAP